MKTSDRKDSESTQHIHTPPYFDTEEDTTDIHAHVHHINDNTDTHAHVHQNERSMSHHDTIDMGSDTVHAKLLTNVSSTRLSLGVNRDDIEMAVHGEAEVMSGGGRSSVGALREQRFEETILGADERVHRPYTAMRGDRVSGAPIIGGPDHEVDRGNGMESECGRHMESQCELVGDSGDRSSARKRNQERVDSGASDTDDAGTESVTHKKVVRRKLHSCRGAEAIECHRENILVHRGFLRAFQAIRDEVVAVIREQMNRHIQEVEPNEQHPESDNGTGSAPYSGPGDRTDNRTTPNNTEAKHTPLSIFITGHSLGGALATLCAYELGLRFDTSQLGLTVYTFGSPRVGNKPFTQKFNRMISHCHRLVNDGDIVTGRVLGFGVSAQVGSVWEI
ncbi:hypothetical protein SARC_09914 [Sphaeroforma arctica JP610]|uniref:Fungal lipase-type domain-containing protein n=1 Tax=Sphaeroforma arctica JP610 TaxID=667725 RepID=A0A0L0FMC1_9EUKA|nr:hypothetical protein SARC_09914 [Sphaeroforma arctica JP610]KNC77626.1 hypothetical protein SARC_09914 [Sphaeroforma arctica JP610]|eukprot:XP_014151528.1 hypothetical protein SARC_09914 [Sphaeroforma arctica JP610]